MVKITNLIIRQRFQHFFPSFGYDTLEFIQEFLAFGRQLDHDLPPVSGIVNPSDILRLDQPVDHAAHRRQADIHMISQDRHWTCPPRVDRQQDQELALGHHPGGKHTQMRPLDDIGHQMRHGGRCSLTV